MKRTAAFMAAITLWVLCSAAHADYVVWDKGTWPQSWPKELEPLRKQSQTLQGSQLNLVFYEIPFTNREDFESAWPHILKIKSKGAPIVLLKSPDNWLGDGIKAGVRIKAPPPEAVKRVMPDAPEDSTKAIELPEWARTEIQLIVDGDIVDLNRIPLPDNTLFMDRRFDHGATGAVGSQPKEPAAAKAVGPKPTGTLDVGTTDAEALVLTSEAGPVRFSGWGGGKYHVPAGRYTAIQVQLAKADAAGEKWRISALGSAKKEGLEIRAGETLALKLGPPLKTKIETRAIDGGRVVISLVLEGQAGEQYAPRAVKGDETPRPPKLKILDEAGKVLAQGNFEYG
jgi:hypothetical protein